ncbi:MAG: hypothetical protein ABL962_03695 [Fimbriimonadaceae bacterium]
MSEVEMKQKTLGEKLLSIPRPVLFLLLIVATALPLFFPIKLPNEPKPEAKALFEAFKAIPDGGTVVIQSDWTESTRGESRGQMDAVLRILMRKNVKFAICAVADPQAPQVARNVVADLNLERKLAGKAEYQKWDDWVNLGFFPNGEGLGQSIRANIRDAFGMKRDSKPGQPERSVFESPVLSKVKTVSDLDMYIVVTGTKSIIVALERFSDKVKMGGLVTGVMGPETLNYYSSGQLVGLSAGLKGVFDMETLMDVEYPGEKNLDKGAKYIVTLHVAVFLLILAVIIGNIGVLMTRRSK